MIFIAAFAVLLESVILGQIIGIGRIIGVSELSESALVGELAELENYPSWRIKSVSELSGTANYSNNQKLE